MRLLRPVWLPGLLLIAVCAAYSAYWWVVRDQAVTLLDDWVAEQAANGVALSWDERSVGGYPFRITGEFDAPQARFVGRTAPETESADMPTLSADGLLLTVMPFDFEHLIAQPLGVIRAPDLQGGHFAIDAEGARASYVAREGAPRLDVETGPLTVERAPPNGDAVYVGGVSRGELHLAQAQDDPSLLRLFLAFGAPHWPQPEAQHAPDEVVLDIQLNHTDQLATPRFVRPTAQAWAAAGGRLTIHTAAAKWGDAALAARGDLYLDAAGAWNGQLTLAFAQPSVVLENLAALGLIETDAVTLIAPMASFAAGADRQVEIPLKLVAGEARLFEVPLGQVPAAF